MPPVRAARPMPRLRPIPAAALAVLAVAATARADSIELNVFSQVYNEYVPRPLPMSDSDEVRGRGWPSVRVNVSSAAGSVFASAGARAEHIPSLVGTGGKIQYGAVGSITSGSLPGRSWVAGSGAGGDVRVDVAVAAPATLRVVYAASGTANDGGNFRGSIGFPQLPETFFGQNAAGSVSLGIPVVPTRTPQLHVHLPDYTAGNTYGNGVSGWVGGTTVVWGLDTLPGETPDNPLGPDSIPPWILRPSLDPSERDASGGDIPASADGTFCSVPVIQSYGIDNFVYIDPELAAGYLYTVEGTLFAQFLLPEALPGGDSLFRLYFNGAFHDYTAGQAFDFTAFAPGGISRFLLLGIDASEGIDPNAPHAPFVSGLKFTTSGLAQVWQVPLTVSAVPEPSSVALLGLGLLGLIGYGCRRRKAEGGPSNGQRVGPGWPRSRPLA